MNESNKSEGPETPQSYQKSTKQTRYNHLQNVSSQKTSGKDPTPLISKMPTVADNLKRSNSSKSGVAEDGLLIPKSTSLAGSNTFIGGSMRRSKSGSNRQLSKKNSFKTRQQAKNGERLPEEEDYSSESQVIIAVICRLGTPITTKKRAKRKTLLILILTSWLT